MICKAGKAKLWRWLGMCCLTMVLGFQVPARANWFDNLRARAGSMLNGQDAKRDAARKARFQASTLKARAQNAHTRLALAQRTLFEANQSYFGITRQIKSTEAKLVRARHRQYLVNERYNRRRILFGRRLAAMQRSGNLSYLQIFLGSSTLSDLTRRFYLFRALIDRDAQLQSELKSDKNEIGQINVQLAREWNGRKSLQTQANRERLRVAQATQKQGQTLKQLVNSRNDLLAYARAREGQIKDLDRQVLAFNARQQAAARQAAAEEAAQEAEQEAYENRREQQRREYAEEDARQEARRANRNRYVSNSDNQTRSNYRSSYRSNNRSYRARNEGSYGSGYRRTRYSSDENRTYRRSRYRTRTRRPRYRTVRLARRVERVRNVQMPGGSLEPMSISEIVFKDERVPVSSGSGTSRASKSSSPPPPAVDDFPASDP